MPQAPTDPLSDFVTRSVTFGGVTHDVFVAGDGPAVVVMPEIPGITPQVADCARRLVAAGFSVWVPSLFGEPGRPFSQGHAIRTIARACVTRQFLAFARAKRAPIIDWLRQLGELAHTESGGPGIGVIGMCFTGNFALTLAIDPRVKVPVMSQPALPLSRSKKSRAALSIAPDDLAVVKGRTVNDDLCVIGLRFTGDPLVHGDRFASLRAEFGDAFLGVEIDSSKGNKWDFPKAAHSVLTAEYRDEPDHPTALAFNLVVDHLTRALLT